MCKQRIEHCCSLSYGSNALRCGAVAGQRTLSTIVKLVL
jgi:hypothetical protein